jgi:hypothetical protein
VGAQPPRLRGACPPQAQGQVEEIAVTEVPVAERPPLLEVYSERYGKFPTVAAVLRALPDPADHPTFRIAPA